MPRNRENFNKKENKNTWHCKKDKGQNYIFSKEGDGWRIWTARQEGIIKSSSESDIEKVVLVYKK